MMECCVHILNSKKGGRFLRGGTLINTSTESGTDPRSKQEKGKTSKDKLKWSALVAIDVFLSLLIFVICIFLSLQLGEFQVGIAISVLGLSASIFEIVVSFYLREPSLTEDMAKALSKVFASGIRRKLVKILLLKPDLLFDEILQEFLNLGMPIAPSRLHNHLLDLQKIIRNHEEELSTGIPMARYRIDEKYEKFFLKNFEIL